jgi:hypothetical protein
LVQAAQQMPTVLILYFQLLLPQAAAKVVLHPALAQVAQAVAVAAVQLEVV